MPTTRIELRPPPYPKQYDAIWCPERYGWIEAGTKSGKTLGCLQWIVGEASKTGEGAQHWWIAPVYAQAKIAYDRLKRGLAPYVDCGIKANDTELAIRLPNGSTITFKSGEKPDNLYGEDVFSAVIDEGSRVREESYHAVRSTLTATKGPLRVIGNVKGRNNWFYKGCRVAEAGQPGHHYAKILCWDAVDAGVLDREEIEDAKRLLPDAVFLELYECIPADDGGNPFGLDAIGACIALPLPDAHSVCYGVDLAKSVDWTVVIGLAPSGHVCSYDRFQAPWGATIKRILNRIGDKQTLVDSTGVGDPIVERMQSERPYVEGFHFSTTSKQQLMEGLASAIQRKCVHYPEGPIAQELRDFEYEYTRTGVRYSAPEGLHDDCVCALALAVRKFELLGLSVPFALIGAEDIDRMDDKQGEIDPLTSDVGWDSI